MAVPSQRRVTSPRGHLPHSPLAISIYLFIITVLTYILMRNSKILFPVTLLAAISAASPETSQSNSGCPAKSNQTVDLSWHKPTATSINNLSTLLNTPGIYGYIFNSSTNPDGTPYGTYNWCNMPHAREKEYVKAPAGFQLAYVEVVRGPKELLWPH